MLRVNLSDGSTLSFDLATTEGRDTLDEAMSRRGFQASVRALTVAHNGSEYSFGRPSGFKDQPVFHVERVDPAGKAKGGVRISCFVGDVRVTIMAHGDQSAVRFAVARVGKQCYSPIVGGGHVPDQSRRS